MSARLDLYPIFWEKLNFFFILKMEKIAIKFYVCATLLASLSSIKMYAFKVTNARYNTSYLHLTTDKCLQTFEMIL